MSPGINNYSVKQSANLTYLRLSLGFPATCRCRAVPEYSPMYQWAKKTQRKASERYVRSMAAGVCWGEEILSGVFAWVDVSIS
jgi:hypothetical protein